MKNKLKFPDKEFLNRDEPQKEVKSAEEILKKHTGFTYPRTGEYNLSDILDAMEEYASQSQPKPTDADIEKWAAGEVNKIDPNEWGYGDLLIYGAKAMRYGKITKQCKE